MARVTNTKGKAPAAEPAPVSQTDNPEEKGPASADPASAPAAAPADQSAAAAGLQPPEGSTDASEQADDAAEASADVDITVAPAALPSGSAVGVTADDEGILLSALDALGGDVQVLPPSPTLELFDLSGQLMDEAERAGAFVQAQSDGELGDIVLVVVARVTRRRAGRSWAAGDIAELTPADINAEQLQALLNDPDFELDFQLAGQA